MSARDHPMDCEIGSRNTPSDIIVPIPTQVMTIPTPTMIQPWKMFIVTLPCYGAVPSVAGWRRGDPGGFHHSALPVCICGSILTCAKHQRNAAVLTAALRISTTDAHRWFFKRSIRPSDAEPLICGATGGGGIVVPVVQAHPIGQIVIGTRFVPPLRCQIENGISAQHRFVPARV